MALFDLYNFHHRGVKCRKGCFAGVRQLDLDKGDVVPVQPDRVINRAIAADDAAIFQTLEPRLGGRFGQPDTSRQFCDRGSTIYRQDIKYLAIETINLTYNFSHDSTKFQAMRFAVF